MRETLVFIPGMMCDERLWQEQWENKDFQQNFFIWNPSAKALEKQTIQEIAKEILKKIPTEKFFGLGLSMGGIILMEILKQARNRVKAIVLANTNYQKELPKRKVQRKAEIEQVKKEGLKKFVVEKMKPQYLSPSLGKNNMKKKKIYTLVTQMALKLGENTFEKQSIALRDRKDYSQTLQNSDCPTLILCGEDDTLCPVMQHQEMHQLIRNSKLEILKKVGHLSCLENSPKFNKIVLNYFCEV